MTLCLTECCLLLKGGKEERFVICCPRERNLYNEDFSKVLCVPAAWIEEIPCNIRHTNYHTCVSSAGCGLTEDSK
jgi:hypothetical protein